MRVGAERGHAQQVALLHGGGRVVVDEDGEADVWADLPQVLLPLELMALGLDGVDIIVAPVLGRARARARVRVRVPVKVRARARARPRPRIRPRIRAGARARVRVRVALVLALKLRVAA